MRRGAGLFRGWIAATLLLVGCEPEVRFESTDIEIVSGDGTVDLMIESQTTAFMRARPNLASYLGLPEDAAGGPYAARLPDYTAAGFSQLRELERGHAAELARIDRAGLSEGARLNLEIVEIIHRYYGGSDAAEYGYIDWYFGHVPYVVSQLAGPAIDVPNVMTAQQRLESASDVADYLGRLGAFDRMMRDIEEKFEADVAGGLSMPSEILDGALSFLDGFVATPAAEHTLVTHLTTAMASIEELNEDDREAHRAEAARIVEEVVYPGYRSVADALRAQVDNVPEGDGIWAQPNGDALYLDLVRFMGDTDLTPPEIHQIGLDEVGRISAEMDAILRREGLTEGTVGERMSGIGDDPRFLYPDSEEGRSELLASLNAQIEEIAPRLPEFFASIPTQAVEVRRIPESTEEGAPGGYYTSPSLDGTRPGIYWINLRDMAAWPQPSLPTLTYHEAIPGHHFQVALNLAQEDLPLLRRNAPFNAYIEGWALYAERLAWEMGLYDGDPFGDLGRLQAELYRAVRLVVDTGLHHQRWTREAAIAYFVSATGIDESEVTAEVERYMAWPGQALGYKLGMLKLMELRQFAEDELGSNFDLRAFHDVILLEGAMPLAVLERRVREWVASGP